jgi:hypothetical protein
VPNYFYPDTDHDDPRITNAFAAALPGLYARGVRTVYMEFLAEIVPTDDQLTEHFATCSGGRRGMAPTYRRAVAEARRLGMRVIGLTRQSYPGLARRSVAENFAFRMMGPFDAVTASVIKRTAGPAPFVVFLGSGHWPILSHYVPGLQLIGNLNEPLPQLGAVPGSEGKMWWAQKEGDDASGGGSTNVVLEVGCAHAIALDSVVAKCAGTDDLGLLIRLAEDRLGVPPDILQINYLLAKRRRTLFLRRPPAALQPDESKPLVMRLRGG